MKMILNTPPHLQGPSKRMAFLKLLVLGTESTIGAQICVKISIKGRHFRLALKKHKQNLDTFSIFKELGC